MIRGLVAPLSDREVRELIYLVQGRDRSNVDVESRERFVMLGLEAGNGDDIVITDLGRQRLAAEQRQSDRGTNVS
jgi:hypothetical protein